MNWPPNSLSNWNFEMLVQRRGENESSGKKTSLSKGKVQLQTRPTYDAESRNQTHATLAGGGGVSALTTVLSLLAPKL